ncbi:hypothetical protein ACFGVS_27165 [Mucilaginibacter sp. AW1-7]|uniref:hypothetical protein n=1 Tax=Mucilaginibacter sp. AW1-7 TaxID=3349874 RepID=UPI003F73BF79
MFDYNNDIEAILQPRVDEQLLVGYFGGVFNPEKDKFYAATLVDISTIDYDEFEYLHEQIGWHTSKNYNQELGKDYNFDRTSYTNKSSQKLIEEGIYQYFSITFLCMLYQEQWFILKTLCFYGDLVNQDGIKANLSKEPDYPDFWQQTLFKPYETLDYLKQTFETASYKDVGMEEFKDAPYLVASLKKGKKEKVNQAWRYYFNEDLILPFFDRIRIELPDQYRYIAGSGITFTMIFPEQKQCTLFCCMVSNSADNWLLHYFVFDSAKRKYYKWVYFEPENFDFSIYYGTAIIRDLKQITNWDNENYLDSSCTMDDDNFWNNYVFAQKDGEYLYLQEI